MKHLRLAIKPIFYAITLGELVTFVGCATDTTTFLNYGNRVPPNVMTAPQVSDGLAINYANSVEIIMRCKATQNRITREVSATAQVGLAAFGGVGAAYNWSKNTLTVLGLGSAAIPQLQGIFDAKGRAEAYNQAAEKIQDGVLEYYAHNSRPSSEDFTPNGLTLVNRVASAINLVNDTINGHLPSQASMQKAVQQMSSEGTTVQNPKEPPVNAAQSAQSLPPPSLPPRSTPIALSQEGIAAAAEQQARRLALNPLVMEVSAATSEKKTIDYGAVLAAGGYDKKYGTTRKGYLQFLNNVVKNKEPVVPENIKLMAAEADRQRAGMAAEHGPAESEGPPPGPSPAKP